MTYYGPKQMADGFRTVHQNTIVIAEEIGEEHYGFRPTPEARSVAQLLMHIGVAPQMTEQIHALRRRSSLVDFDFPAFFVRMQNEEQKAIPKAQIIEFLRTEGDRFATWLGASARQFFSGESVKFPSGPATSHEDQVRDDSRRERARNASPGPANADQAAAGASAAYDSGNAGSD